MKKNDKFWEMTNDLKIANLKSCKQLLSTKNSSFEQNFANQPHLSLPWSWRTSPLTNQNMLLVPTELGS